MSDVDTPRNDAGQFTPDTSNLFGREYELVSNNFTAKKDGPPEEAASDNSDPVRQAAADLAARRAEPGNISVVEIKNQEDFKPREARTIEQAADEYEAARSDVAKFAEGVDLSMFAEKVDEDRAKVIKGDAKVAESLGIEMAPDEAKADVAAEDNSADDRTDGLDPETRKALKIPAVRAAIEQEFSKAEAAQQSYQTALATANQFAMASLVDHFPELGQIPVEQWEPALGILAQQDPTRFERAMGVLDRVSRIQGAQSQWQQQQVHVQRQQFEAARQQYSRAADEALGPMTRDEKAQMVDELISYVEEYGISREQFAREAETNLALHHPAFQRMAADAIKYRRIQAAPKAIPQSLPAVQRPGVAREIPRGTDNASQIKHLQKQLAGAHGDKAARIAGQIRSLKRAS